MDQQTAYDIDAYNAQKKYCEEKGYPLFLYYRNGQCFRCGNSVFRQPGGYTIEHAGSHLITGCPFCNASFCE